MRIKNSKPAPPREFFREARLRANRFQKPHTLEANGAKFLIAGNGIKIPMNLAIESELPDAVSALRREGKVVMLS